MNYELWMIDADGTSNPTFVATSSSYVVSGTDVQRIVTAYTITTPVSTGGITRRFLEKHYRKRTGVTTGANPVITVYYGGIYEGFITVQIPSAVVMRTDGANAEADVLFNGISGDYLDLPITGGNPSHKHGRIFWDQDDDTLAIYTENASFVHQVGQELTVRAKNVSGETILDGQAIYISSTTV